MNTNRKLYIPKKIVSKSIATIPHPSLSLYPFCFDRFSWSDYCFSFCVSTTDFPCEFDVSATMEPLIDQVSLTEPCSLIDAADLLIDPDPPAAVDLLDKTEGCLVDLELLEVVPVELASLSASAALVRLCSISICLSCSILVARAFRT